VHAERANRVASPSGTPRLGGPHRAAARRPRPPRRRARDPRREGSVAMLVATRDDPALHLLSRRSSPARTGRRPGAELHDRPGVPVGRESRRVAGPATSGRRRSGGLPVPSSFFRPTSRRRTLVAWSWRRCPESKLRILDLYSARLSPCLALRATRSPPSRRAGRRPGTPSSTAARTRARGPAEARVRSSSRRCPARRRRLRRRRPRPPREGCPSDVVRGVFGA